MGYPNFGKVKNIVLPCDTVSSFTLEQYKEKYGIDLKEFLRLDDQGEIRFIARNAVLYITSRNYATEIDVLYDAEILIPVTSSLRNSYDAGNTPAELVLGSHNVAEGEIGGIKFEIDKDDAFTLDNVKVSYHGF